ncbi:hypothetical protein [Synechococcus sp. ROS8604]|uniref:hypothetical protein n=1 Tax=Synechococcus sp. ROS8604 TaxID=1442557 RepID=UPI0016453D98|nr:hypothetical protein [Synechococcus sp. ROS8604]QNI87632.1 hypothetical protein SynROS8604_00989 [Synechococcus sp. ROS8604]
MTELPPFAQPGNPHGFDDVVIKITMLADERLSITRGRINLQTPVGKHQQIGSHVANKSIL